MSYHIFSHFYDKVMDQSVYMDWMDYVKKYQDTNHAGEDTLEIMELACGTGNIAVQLAKAGHEVTAVDLSADMLILAQERMQQEGVELQLVESDMRELDDLGAFDMVTCFSDSLCYLQEEADLAQVFAGVFANLKPGGTFLFDVHSLYQMNEVFPGYQYIFQEDANAFLWESYALDQPDSVEHVLTFFVEQEEGRFVRMQEVHEERTFPMETYRSLLEQAGFKHIEVTGEFGREEVTDTTPRWFFSAQK